MHEGKGQRGVVEYVGGGGVQAPDMQGWVDGVVLLKTPLCCLWRQQGMEPRQVWQTHVQRGLQ